MPPCGTPHLRNRKTIEKGCWHDTKEQNEKLFRGKSCKTSPFRICLRINFSTIFCFARVSEYSKGRREMQAKYLNARMARCQFCVEWLYNILRYNFYFENMRWDVSQYCKVTKCKETLSIVNLSPVTSYFASATENLPVIDCNISPAHEIKVTLLCTWPSATSNKYLSRLTAINGSWDQRDTDFGKHSGVIRIWVAWECQSYDL